MPSSGAASGLAVSGAYFPWGFGCEWGAFCGKNHIWKIFLLSEHIQVNHDFNNFWVPILFNIISDKMIFFPKKVLIWQYFWLFFSIKVGGTQQTTVVLTINSFQNSWRVLKLLNTKRWSIFPCRAVCDSYKLATFEESEASTYWVQKLFFFLIKMQQI